MNRTIHPKGVEYLVQAIVGQARRDYLDSKPDSESRKEVERFFLSRHFAILTGLDGQVVLKRLQAEYYNKQRRRKWIHDHC